MKVLYPLIVSSIAACVPASVAQAQCDAQWVYGPAQGFPTVEGRIDHSIAWDPDGAGPSPELIVVAGTFSNAGLYPARNIAAWDGVQWRQLGTGTTGTINALAVLDGKLVAAGNFTTIGGVSASNIAAWDGTTWSASLGSLFSVNALTVHQGQLYCTQSNAVRVWNGASWQTVGTQLNSNLLKQLHSDGANLYVCGSFTLPGSTGKTVARLDGSSWVAVGKGMNGDIESLATYNGSLYAGGWFSTSGTNAIPGVARWNGTAWESPGGGMDPYVNDLVVHDGKLIAVGTFTIPDDISAWNVASWDGTEWSPMGAGIPAGANTLTSSTHGLFVGGSFPINSELQYCGLWNGQTWNELAYRAPFFTGTLASIEYKGDLYATAGGGNATSRAPLNLAKLRDGVWSQVGPNGIGSGNMNLRALAIYQDRLIIGGGFTTAGGISANYIVAWDGETWSALGSGLSGAVRSLVVHQGDLIAGSISGTIHRWDGSSWMQMGSARNYDIYTLQSHEGTLYAGGKFTGGLVRWNLSSWEPCTVGMGSEVIVNDLYVHNGELYAAGLFSLTGNTTCKSVAKWDGTSWQPVGVTPPGFATKDVWGLTTYNGDLYAHGFFIDNPGHCDGVARWDGVSWTALGTGVSQESVSLAVYEAIAHRDELHLFGAFDHANGRISRRWARWASDGLPRFASDPKDTTLAPGETLNLSVIVAPGYDERAPITYQWQRDGVPINDGPSGASDGGGEVSGSTSASLFIAGAQPTDAGSYDCVVSNDCGDSTSAPATIAINCPADVDGTGFVDIDDYVTFVGFFEAGVNEADFDQSGFVDIEDFVAFVAAFENGC